MWGDAACGSLRQRPPSAAPNSDAVAKRSAGTRAIAFWQIPSSIGLTVVRVDPERSRRFGEHARQDHLRGGSGEWRFARDHLVEHAAERVDVGPARRRRGVPPTCSGLMYAGVPIAMPGSVPFACPNARAARAIPKSATIAWLASEQMFSGFTSRWIRPRGMGEIQRVGHFAGHPDCIFDG